MEYVQMEEKMDKTEKTLEDVRLRQVYMYDIEQSRSVCLLFTGSLLGLLGFVFAAYLGVRGPQKGFGKQPLNLNGDPFPSHYMYFPETVSEMVSDPKSPSGMAFFGFVMTGAICMLLSWYPWNLDNVNVSDEIWSFGKGYQGMFLNFRSLLPPIGMMIVACIHVVPRPLRTESDTVTCTIHTLGAVLALGGYFILEAFTLHRYNDVKLPTLIRNNRLHHFEASQLEEHRIHPKNKRAYTQEKWLRHGDDFHRLPNGEFAKWENAETQKIGAVISKGTYEMRIRRILVICGAVSIVLFQIGGYCVGHQDFGHKDDWIEVKMENVDRARNNSAFDVEQQDLNRIAENEPGIYNTAAGIDRAFKQLEFWGEVGAGVFMILSHWSIWYYCKERQINLPDAAPVPLSSVYDSTYRPPSASQLSSISEALPHNGGGRLPDASLLATQRPVGNRREPV